MGGARPTLTSIYYLLEGRKASRLHRVNCDEVWNFYRGAPVDLVAVDPVNLNIGTTALGAGDPATHQTCIPAGHWQGARSTGSWSLVGCTVAPGFDFEDFQLIDDADPEILKRLQGLRDLKPYL